MKTKKFLIIITVLLMLIPFLSVSAYNHLLSDSDSWENLSDKEATALLKSTKNAKDESFILIYYRKSCGYSKNYVPQFESYAKENGIKLYGLDDAEYSSWYEWLNYTSNFVITFPMVLAYNHEEDALCVKQPVHSVSALKKILEEINYPISTANEEPEEQNKTTQFFKDVDSNNKYYSAVKNLVSKGIVNGYDDNTFKPNNPINRAEAATVIVRAAGLSIDKNAKSVYSDVADKYWGTPYIMAATKAGIINGMGDNMFVPTNNVTHNQIIKMVVCMMNMDTDVEKNGGWPNGYLVAAEENNIIDFTTYANLLNSTGNTNATRGDVAQYVYNALKTNDSQTIYIDGNKYFIGMSTDDLDTPDEVLPSTSIYDWYVYGTDTYKNFIALGVVDNKVVALASSGAGFTYMGYKAGDLNTDNINGLETDKNDNDKIHGVFIDQSGKSNGSNINDEAFEGESKMNFHFANAFRVLHGKKALKWCDDAATAAKLHSQDMANKNYFAHDSIDGRKFSQRLTEQGIYWSTCGENISAGRVTGFASYCGWVNSSGHRKNMLNNSYEYLGVGAGFNLNSTYRYYFTQDFYA